MKRKKERKLIKSRLKKRSRIREHDGVPKKVFVGDDVVRIKQVAGYIGSDVVNRTLGGHYGRGGIELSTFATRPSLRLILFHELLHEALDQAGIKNKTPEAELFMDGIDDWMLNMLRDNPKLRKFLFEDAS